MPFIYKNGKRYSGTSNVAGDIVYDNAESGLVASSVQSAIDYLAANGSGAVDLTEAEYNVLKEAGELNPSITYYITDGELPEENRESTGVIELTQAEYDELSEEEKMSDTIYAITDVSDLEAKYISYDGSKTGLGNSIQDAVDNLDNKINEQNNNLIEQINDIKSSLAVSATSEKGTISVASGPWETKNYTVSFTKPFNTIPTVIATSSNNDCWYCIKRFGKRYRIIFCFPRSRSN